MPFPRPYPGMDRGLTALVTLLDNGGRPRIEDLDLAGISANRRVRYPRGRLAQRLTGTIDPSVMVLGGHAIVRDGSSLRLRIYRPARADSPAPGIVFFHGGGWVQGNVVNYDPLCSTLAAGVGAVVVSVDYRLAPEHRAPTATEDAIDATAWVAERAAEYGVDPARLALAGDSAGGNLAALVAQDLGARIRAQALIYPAVDLTLGSASIAEHAHAPVLTRAGIDAFRQHYLGGSGIAADDPVVSPLFGPLAGVAPALIQTADLDPIRDDGVRYAEALAAAGVPVRHTNYLRAPHGFASFAGAYRDGARHRAELVGFLLTHLAPAGAPEPSGD